MTWPTLMLIPLAVLAGFLIGRKTMNDKVRASLLARMADLGIVMDKDAVQIVDMPDRITAVHQQGIADAPTGDTSAELAELRQQAVLDREAMTKAAQALIDLTKGAEERNAQRDQMFANQLEHGNPLHPLPASGTPLPGA